MTSLHINRRYKVPATYWAKTGDSGFGSPTLSAPVAISCYWVDKQEEYYDNAGDVKISQSVVHTKVDVTIGGYLALGNYVETDPNDVAGAYEIKAFHKIPDIHNTEYVRKAIL